MGWGESKTEPVRENKKDRDDDDENQQDRDRERQTEREREERERKTESARGDRERGRDGEREKDVKLMQLVSRTNVFGAAEYRSLISSGLLLLSGQPASFHITTYAYSKTTTVRKTPFAL